MPWVSWWAEEKGSSSGVDMIMKLFSFFAMTLVIASLSGWIGGDRTEEHCEAAGGSSRLGEVASLGSAARAQVLDGGEPRMKYSR